MHTPSKQFRNLLIRWAVNSFGVWLAVSLLDSVTNTGGTSTLIVSGLVLSLVNAVVKPAVMIMALPAILFSLGIFIVFVNGLMVLLADFFVSDLVVADYGSAILAGMVIGLVNYVLTNLIERSSLWKTY